MLVGTSQLRVQGFQTTTPRPVTAKASAPLELSTPALAKDSAVFSASLPNSVQAGPVPVATETVADKPANKLAAVANSPSLLLAELPELEEAKELPSISPLEAIVLRELAPTGPAKSVMFITDMGRDQDDEVAVSALAKLQEMGNIDLKAVITTLGPSERRGQLAKGALAQLGLPDVPVAAGSAAGQDPGKVHEYEFDAPYLAAPESVDKDAQGLMKKALQDADDKSMTFLVAAAMTDMAQFIEENKELFAQKAERVVFMGGVNRKDGEVSLENGRMTPDTANNNTFDKDASKTVYQAVQDLGVPSTIVTREAAYAVPVTKSFYDEIGGTGNPVGERLCAAQRRSIQGLWDRVNLPDGDPARGGLPGRCDKAWFENTFCAGPVQEGADVWDNVTKLPAYDAVAALAVLGKDQTSKMFTPTVVNIDGTEHEIIGLSTEQPGIGQIGADLALSALTKSIMLDHRP